MGSVFAQYRMFVDISIAYIYDSFSLRRKAIQVRNGQPVCLTTGLGENSKYPKFVPHTVAFTTKESTAVTGPRRGQFGVVQSRYRGSGIMARDGGAE